MTDTEFQDAFHAHKNVVFRFAYRMTASIAVAEDIVQDCFLTLWRKPAFDPRRGTLRAFLLGIARNLILKRWRDEHQAEALDDESFVCAPFDLAREERSNAVARAVQMLPPLQREALILAEYEEMSLEEIAAATCAEIGAVKSRLHRARVNLRRMLAPLMESQANSKEEVYGTKR
jgi:RNA polymerase sigma-70 factor (ECF subfamily)